MVATDGQNITLGAIELEITLTPGLTPDCLAIILKEDGVAKFLFPSELLLLHEVTKPDSTMPKEQFDKVCIQMYNSLKKKISSLDDSVVVLPIAMIK